MAIYRIRLGAGADSASYFDCHFRAQDSNTWSIPFRNNFLRKTAKKRESGVVGRDFYSNMKVFDFKFWHCNLARPSHSVSSLSRVPNMLAN